jgi:hypothetical protein
MNNKLATIVANPPYPFTAKELANKTPHLIACRADTPPTKRELYICQDDVLLHALHAARDMEYQAVWPIKGKLPNARTTAPSAIFNQPAIKELMAVLYGDKEVIQTTGRQVGVIEDLDQVPMQYQTIVLALDCDHDGAHLAMLLLGFFQKYMPHLYEQGRIYINMAPFKKVLNEQTSKYEFEYHLSKVESQDQAILTLAEMQADDAREHILAPATRRLGRLHARDMQRFNDIMEIAQSSNAQMRNALLAENPSQALLTHSQPRAGEVMDLDPAQVAIDCAHTYAHYVNHGKALIDVASGLTSIERALMGTALTKYADSQHPERAFQLVGHTMLACMGTVSEAQLADSLVRISDVPSIYGRRGIGAGENTSSGQGTPQRGGAYSQAPLIELIGNPNKLRSLHFKLSEFGKLGGDAVPLAKDQEISFPWPNVLVRGHKGVGYGVACEIPAHDMHQVIQATLALIDNPDIPLLDLIKILSGPDLEGRGVLVNTDDLYEAYKTGQGTYMVQGKAHIEVGGEGSKTGENGASGANVVITELPPGVTPHMMIEDIKKGYLAEDGIEKLIYDRVPVDASDSEGIRISIAVNNDCSMSAVKTNAELLLMHIKTYRSFSSYQKINITVSNKGEVKQMGLKELLIEWIVLRQEYIKGRRWSDADKAEKVMRKELSDLMSETIFHS